MLAAPWLEPIREPEEIFLVDRVQHLDHRALDDLASSAAMPRGRCRPSGSGMYRRRVGSAR